MKTIRDFVVCGWAILVFSGVAAGLEVPPQLQVTAARGTGRTTGHIATITVRNTSANDQVYELPACYIPATNRFQSYIVPWPSQTPVAAGQTRQIPVQGYCSDIHAPPVPDGDDAPPVEKWVPVGPIPNPADIQVGAGAYQERDPETEGNTRPTYPGTDQEVDFRIDAKKNPVEAAPFLIAAARAIEKAYDKLADDGKVSTPFSASKEREKESVVQQTIWIYAAELEGDQYTKEDFSNKLQEQLEENSGTSLETAPPPVKKQFNEGVNQFWDSFNLVGLEAKVISHPEGEKTESQPEGVAVPVKEGCTPHEKLEHSPANVKVIVADSYGDDESRQAIREGIKEDITSGNEAYMTSAPPATAFALWGHDHVGGNASAYAKTILLKDQGTDWVWSTEPMSVEAEGSSEHTLSFEHGPKCKAVVAGTALLWLKGSSDALDPLENSIEVFRTLDAVKELSVKYVTRKLPSGISDAIEAGVDAMTDPASDTYAAAIGTGTLTVGTATASGKAENRVVYKRKDKEDSAIVGGGEKVTRLSASDVQPDSLTSSLQATAKMEAGATGNGLAKAHLESLYGTILIGVCQCETGMMYKVLTDTGLFVKSEGAAEKAKRAKKELQNLANTIGKEIEDGDLETTGEALKERIEKGLSEWGESIGGDTFAEE